VFGLQKNVVESANPTVRAKS
jgi:hypothetical protein